MIANIEDVFECIVRKFARQVKHVDCNDGVPLCDFRLKDKDKIVIHCCNVFMKIAEVPEQRSTNTMKILEILNNNLTSAHGVAENENALENMENNSNGASQSNAENAAEEIRYVQRIVLTFSLQIGDGKTTNHAFNMWGAGFLFGVAAYAVVDEFIAQLWDKSIFEYMGLRTDCERLSWHGSVTHELFAVGVYNKMGNFIYFPNIPFSVNVPDCACVVLDDVILCDINNNFVKVHYDFFDDVLQHSDDDAENAEYLVNDKER